MCLSSFLRLVSMRMRIVVAFSLPALLFLAYGASIWLHRARVDHDPPGINNGSNTDRSLEDDPEALIAKADHFYWLNNGPRAAPLYGRAEQLFSERGDARNEIHARVGHLRSQAETMSFVELSRFLEQELHKPMMERDRSLRLWCLIAKGYTDIEIDYRAAKRDWLEAQNIAKDLGQTAWVTRASGELGLIAFLEGNPGRAARLLGSALLSTMTNGDTGGQIRFLELIGNGFEEVNRHAEALKFFDRAIKLAESEKDSGLPFIAYEGKGQALVALGKQDEARKVLEDALTKARSQQKKAHEAQLLILLGRLAARTGDIHRAIEYLEHAGQFATDAQFFRMEADAMFELARLYRDTDDLVTADARATQGLAASKRVGDRYYVPRNMTILADLKARRGHVSEASALYTLAEDVIEGMLISVAEPYWNSSVVGSMSETYLHHFELLNKSGDVPDAFNVLERVRGRTLTWALEDRRAIQASQPEQTAALESEVASLQLQLMQTSDSGERQQLLDKLVEIERRLGFAWTNAPDKRLPARPAPLKKVREDLAANEILLEYVLDDPNSFCIAITRNSARVQILPAGVKQIESLIQEYLGEIRAKGKAIEQSKRLWEYLVKPVPEAATKTRLVVAPDGMLNLVPFESLRDERGRFLLASRVISYIPSATILDSLRRAQELAPAPRPLLAVGDVAYDNQGGVGRKVPPAATFRGRIERGIADLSGIALHDLPQTREEVQEIGKVAGPDAVLLLDTNATETAFKKEPLDQFRILHLAVHGFADTQYPERSALVLGADPKSGDDGLLQVREIIRLRLNAELTTLSACDSGVGKLQGQEGVSNLVEAFLVAGSKSVVASLWNIDDASTSALMEDFYERLARGEPTSLALRNAKLNLLAKFGDQLSPYYWAAFICVGETLNPIPFRRP